MESKKNLGIWMDYSTADLIDGNRNDQILSSGISPELQDETFRGERHQHQKEQQAIKEYFKEIASKMDGYDQVLLFGPTNAKTELQNYLQKEKLCTNQKVFLETTDKMTDNQKQAFVKKFFHQ